MTATIATLRAELRDDTALVATARPRLTWTVDSDEAGWVQASVDLRAVSGANAEEVTLDIRDSVLVDWPFSDLGVGESREVTVRARSAGGTQTDWSAPARVTAAFLADDEWIAQPIGLAHAERPAQPVLLRTRFTLDRPVRRVTLLWTALGSAEPEINGRPVSDDVLAPGWTSYRDRLIHETVDVTDLVHEGENVLAAALAGAWYTEKYGFFVFTDQVYGDQPSLLAQLRVEYADGSFDTLASTGDGWRALGDGPIVDSGIYAGEHQDLRRAIAGWSTPEFDDSAWPPARVGAVARPGYENVPRPEARIAPPVRRIETSPVVEVFTSPSGARILDFGQNLVGRLRLRVTGAEGDRITVRHAEVLDEGELALRPLRNSASTATFDLAGGEETLESRFTFHGFRYAQIDGWPGEFDPASVEAVVLHTDMTRTGWFESSDPMVNRLHENVVWGMRGNFLSIPTDCPQRDERLGWTGDIQVFSPTAAYLYDSDAFLTSWLRDLALEQTRNDGDVPVVVPQALTGFGGPGSLAAWGDAATVVPAVLHQSYGDLGVLRVQYPSMRAWVECVSAQAGDTGLWAGQMQLGDWLDPSAPPDKPGDAKVDGDIVATAYFARSLRIVAESAALLGETEDAARYTGLADRARDAFVAEYVTPAGRMMSDAPTAYALALEFGLVTRPKLRDALAQRLADVVREGGYRIATGFVGTPLVTDALTKGGHKDAAERLLLQTENPSWLYPVTMGATTIWERWDSLLPDGSVNPGEMTSFNHYALGAVADWLHRTVAGLAPEEPGYRVLRIAPRPLSSFDSASATLRSPYGHASVAWRRDGDDVVVTARVPANTTAIVDLPDREIDEVGSGAHEWRFRDEAAADRGIRFDLSSSLADVIDEPRAYRALLDTIAAVDPGKAEAVRAETKWAAGRTVRSALMFTPPDLIAAVDEALAAVSSDASTA
ncbi:alpha-L-rhamnosidase [Microbacterium pygmaeum]|uniref:alpha-L-rhamnosidase n=1 Tax=Microbacterium pygmaeum TaxID=370764 RepID=A0A1G7WTK7_9MICO|nr:alpha-L-rhamnosidase [Microbacterium pygmaeum]SDG74620.1 alpha-L-rhamnosidase [Microbacterium pygmaeum]